MENLTAKQTKIIMEMANNQHCLDNMECYPYTKPYTMENLPMQKMDDPLGLFEGMEYDVCNVNDINELVEIGMVDIKNGELVLTKNAESYLVELCSTVAVPEANKYNAV